jgi:pimeloyl-ACP methyl ester carboxylesterase
MGRTGPVIAFIHPNPMDQSCWIFQMTHLSTWYRCIAIDIPGYGRSPKADAGLTMSDMAQACWEAIDETMPGESAILAGCSVGSSIAPFMYHQRPNKTAALVLSGTGYNPTKEFTKRRIDNYTANGIDYRWAYTFEDLSPAFRTTPMAHFFANLFTERNDHPDRQRGRQPSERLRAQGAHYQLRIKNIAGSRPRLPAGAALVIRSFHDRISFQARPIPRRIPLACCLRSV